MENIKIKIYSVFNASKNPVIERFNRTITNKLWKQLTINGNQKWLKILQPTVDKYNNSFHRTIRIQLLNLQVKILLLLELKQNLL